jgi:hypothetical protein
MDASKIEEGDRGLTIADRRDRTIGGVDRRCGIIAVGVGMMIGRGGGVVVPIVAIGGEGGID